MDEGPQVCRGHAPVVTAMVKELDHVVPFANFHTVAEAMTSGNPPGGDEIVRKARENHWLAASVTEEQILDGQRQLARCGHFVEPAAATTLHAVRQLRDERRIEADASVVMMLTGAGLKDMSVLKHHMTELLDCDVDTVELAVTTFLARPA